MLSLISGVWGVVALGGLVGLVPATIGRPKVTERSIAAG
jgi:hypothetical protein